MPTLIVEDGTGLSNANTYLSEADADTYWVDHGNNTTWSAATATQKQEALIIATQYMDANYNTRWLGTKDSQTQSLAWPRSGVVDYDGYLLSNNELPQAVQDATAEAAVRHLSSALIPDVDNPGGIKSEKVQVGALANAVEYAGAAGQLPSYPLIDMILRHLLTGVGTMERG
jgi:hypothetical protein